MKTYLPLGAAALALVGLLLLLHPGGGDTQPAGHLASTQTVGEPSPSTGLQTPVTPNLGGGGEPLPAQVAGQRKIVAGFAHAFTSTVPQQQWIEALKPYVTAELLEGFRHTDPRVRPTGQVAKISYAEPAGVFRVDYTDGDPILIHLGQAGTSWSISGVDPVPPPPPPTGNDL